MPLAPLILLILMSSCASVKKDRALTWEAWKQHPVSDVENHPYFRTLPLKKISHDRMPETWVYRDQSKFQTSAYCESLGGCVGLPTYSCDNIFSIKDGVVLGFEQKGSCPEVSLTDPDRK